MPKASFKLPKTVGPWFTYWLEYIPDEELGAERKKWFRENVQKVLTGNPFGRRSLDSIAVTDLTNFLEGYVYPAYSREDSAKLRLYFHYALVAARNLGGAKAYTVSKYLTAGQLLARRIWFSFLAVAVVFSVFVSSLTLDRVVRKQEDLLTATATVLRESGLGVAVAFAEDIYYSYVNPARVGGVPLAAAAAAPARPTGSRPASTLTSPAGWAGTPASGGSAAQRCAGLPDRCD